MSSSALDALLTGLAEIRALQRANPSPQQGSGLKRPEVVRAIGRSEIVLLSSHFERFIYALNEEAAASVCEAAVLSSALPELVKLEHSRLAIDSIFATSWERRGPALQRYSADEADIWSPNAVVIALDASRLLTWMKAPNPKNIIRFFQIWGIKDIFSEITRKKVTYAALRLRLGELVEKRNNIAHGDFTAGATYLDIIQYVYAVRTFCTRADVRLAKKLSAIIGSAPW
jgi:RiboL-PSP-HEPN